MPGPDETQRTGPPVIELDPCELELVTDADHQAAGLVRRLPPPTPFTPEC